MQPSLDSILFCDPTIANRQQNSELCFYSNEQQLSTASQAQVLSCHLSVGSSLGCFRCPCLAHWQVAVSSCWCHLMRQTSPPCSCSLLTEGWGQLASSFSLWPWAPASLHLLPPSRVLPPQLPCDPAAHQGLGAKPEKTHAMHGLHHSAPVLMHRLPQCMSVLMPCQACSTFLHAPCAPCRWLLPHT